MIGYQNDYVHEYSLSTAFDLGFTDPTLTSSVPADNATGVALDANIVLNFSENVDTESGNITIKKTSGNAVVETIDVTDTDIVTGTGTSQITIIPSSNFDNDTGKELIKKNKEKFISLMLIFGQLKLLQNRCYKKVCKISTPNFLKKHHVVTYARSKKKIIKYCCS